jgi:hypothetical protein
MPSFLFLSQATFVFSTMLLLMFDFSLAMADATILRFRGSVGHSTVVVFLHPIPI